MHNMLLNKIYAIKTMKSLDIFVLMNRNNVMLLFRYLCRYFK